MSNRAFIQANECQLIAAKVAKFALETTGRAREHGISVTIMNVNEMEPFNAFDGATYRSEDRIVTFDVKAPQSFSL
jgi:hypothetical protein